MSVYKRLAFFILLAAFPFPACRVWAQDDGDWIPGPRHGFSLGGRGSYYRPKGADSGDFMQGAQARFHFTRRWAAEGSVDLRKDKFGGTNVDVIPVQLSVLVYLMPPGYRIAPYLLAGGGWYYTHVGTPANNYQFRFGPHAGGGVEYVINRAWTIDGSYRYLWTEDINSQDAEHPLGRNFKDKGFMLTIAVNYYF